MRLCAAVVLLTLICIAGCSTPPEQPRLLIGGAELTVMIADTPDEREVGLMHRDSLPENEGMLFLLDDEEVVGFWMKDTLIPLDIIFIDKDWKIVNIRHSAQPCTAEPCESYFSDSPVRYVLEVNAGFTQRYGISEGASVRLLI